MNTISWQNVIFFFDVDDTLIDTASNSIIASNSIHENLSKYIDPNTASKIQERFNRIFLTLMQGHTAKNDDDWFKIEGGREYHDSVLKKIEILQQPVIQQYGSIKKWSREVILKIAAEDFNINLSNETLIETIDEYWNTISENSLPIPGVLDLFNVIKKHNRPIYFITSSDARLQLNTKGLFIYNPAHSEAFKIKRMNTLKNKGLDFDQASIGDPEDKPHLDFFEKGIHIAEKDLAYSIDHKNIIMFGDSYAGDLQTPREKLNFGLVVLFRKGQDVLKEEGDTYISTGNLFDITTYLR